MNGTSWTSLKKQSSVQVSCLYPCCAPSSESPFLRPILSLIHPPRFISSIMILEAFSVTLLSQTEFLSISLYSLTLNLSLHLVAYSLTTVWSITHKSLNNKHCNEIFLYYLLSYYDASNTVEQSIHYPVFLTQPLGLECVWALWEWHAALVSYTRFQPAQGRAAVQSRSVSCSLT